MFWFEIHQIPSFQFLNVYYNILSQYNMLQIVKNNTKKKRMKIFKVCLDYETIGAAKTLVSHFMWYHEYYNILWWRGIWWRREKSPKGVHEKGRICVTASRKRKRDRKRPKGI